MFLTLRPQKDGMPTIAANLIIEDGKLLMLHRNDKGYWELPAGKVEDGETPRQAAIREAREEIGCDVVIQAPWSRFEVSFEHDGEQFETRGFLSAIAAGDPEIQEDKFDELAWVDEDALRDLALAPNLEMIVNDLRLLLMRSA